MSIAIMASRISNLADDACSLHEVASLEFGKGCTSSVNRVPMENVIGRGIELIPAIIVDVVIVVLRTPKINTGSALFVPSSLASSVSIELPVSSYIL